MLETSPSSLGLANYILTKTYNRGVDDIGAYTYLLKLLIQHVLNLAEKYPERAEEYKMQVLPMTYNLANNTWIGWGEGEVGTIEESHRKLGLEAAQLNVQIGGGTWCTTWAQEEWLLGAWRSIGFCW